MLYRTHKVLSRGKGKTIPENTTTSLAWLTEKQIALLLERQIVSEVAAPPLVVLPKWEKWARRINRLGIFSVIEFLEANDEMLAETLGEKPDVITGWKAEAEAWLTVDLPKKKKY
jgi:hypothetical protein